MLINKVVHKGGKGQKMVHMGSIGSTCKWPSYLSNIYQFFFLLNFKIRFVRNTLHVSVTYVLFNFDSGDNIHGQKLHT